LFVNECRNRVDVFHFGFQSQFFHVYSPFFEPFAFRGYGVRIGEPFSPDIPIIAYEKKNRKQ
jgi:hypothetical protein